jgi:glycosyltransferase involved in cell wall biosynthesis
VIRPYSRLFVVGDRLGWSIDDDRDRLVATARRLGYPLGTNALLRFARRQSVFQHNHFNALQQRWLGSSHRIGLSYFHGRPGTPGYPEFDRAYDTLRENAPLVDRVQVTHEEMHELVVGAGVPPERVFTIPIGIDLENFPLAPETSRSEFVIGSFLKDGVGMEEGLEPKLLKGPDTFVAVVARLREAIPDLSVLLTGPARGYVRGEQATEVVVDGENGLLADVDDVDALVAAVERVQEDAVLRARLRAAGRATAEAHAEERLDPLWANLLEGFVDRG